MRAESKRLSVKKGSGAEGDGEWETEEKPFLHLTLDLPATPLYADSLEKNIIPQVLLLPPRARASCPHVVIVWYSTFVCDWGSACNVPYSARAYMLRCVWSPPPHTLHVRADARCGQVPLLNILHKFDGHTENHTRGRLSRYRLLKLPRYIIFHIKRFSKNTQFQVEKNPTIVSFPIKKLDLGDFVDLPDELKGQVTHYDLVANICHEGLVTKASYTNESHDKGTIVKDGIFRAQVLNKSQDQWYQIDDLHIQEILPQVVSISEAYVQIYERSDITMVRHKKKSGGPDVKNEDDVMHM